VEHHTKPAADSPRIDWPRHEYNAPTSQVLLTSLAIHLSLVDIYAGVDLP
jgi:hypothetical protein